MLIWIKRALAGGQTLSKLLVVAALLVPSAGLVLAGWLNYQQLEEQTRHHAQQRVDILSEHAARTLRAHQIILDAVNAYFSNHEWASIFASASGHQVLRSFVDRSPEIASVFMLAPDGKQWLSSRTFPMPSIDANDRDYFSALKQSQADPLFISHPMVGRLIGDRFFTVARRRSASSNGRGAHVFNGVVGVSVAPSYFEEFYTHLVEASGDAAYLLRKDGLVLAQYPQAVETSHPALTTLQAATKKNLASAFIDWRDGNGQHHLLALRQVGDFGVYVAFQRSQVALWAQWRKTMSIYALAALLASALLLAVAALASQRLRSAEAESRSLTAEATSRAKDHFIAVLSHELRSPLGAIGNAAQVLDLQQPTNPTVKVITRQVRHLKGILNDLLDSARALHGKLVLQTKLINLEEIISTSLADHPQLNVQRVRHQHADGALWVQGDPVRLKQMLDNLLDNAFKYGGKTVWLESRVDQQQILIDVRDNGQGIAAELLPHLFEPFVQATHTDQRARGGLGLGLALVNRLALLHQGRLTVQSAGLGQGSCFTLRLPQAQPNDLCAQSVERTQKTEPRQVLLVDDEADSRNTLSALLTMDGHYTQAVACGVDALACVKKQLFDVALIDLDLPEMDGYQVARKLRQSGTPLCLIAVSGHGREEDKQRAAAAGFDAHLTKPVALDQLRALLQDSRATLAVDA